MLIKNNNIKKTTTLSTLNKLFSNIPNKHILKHSNFHLPKNIQPKNFKKQKLIIKTIFKFNKLLNNQTKSNPTIPFFFKNFIIKNPNSLPKLHIKLKTN